MLSIYEEAYQEMNEILNEDEEYDFVIPNLYWFTEFCKNKNSKYYKIYLLPVIRKRKLERLCK